MPRSKTFDTELILTRAMELFWINGADHTSISQLEAHLELGRISLYGAYGNKSALFAKCLHQYRVSVAKPLLQSLDEPNGFLGVKHFFEHVTNAPPPIRRRGCLIVNTLASSYARTDAVKGILQKHLHDVEQKFARAVECGIAVGSIDKNRDVQETAGMLTALAHGVFSLNRSNDGATIAKAAANAMLMCIASSSRI